MAELVKIEGTELAIREYNGQRVVTFKDIDTVHHRPDGTSRRNFNRNRTRFVEGEDYFRVCANEIRTHKIVDISNKTVEDVVLLTEMGYLMVVKSLKDDLAWQVQRQLVNAYFKAKEFATAVSTVLIDDGLKYNTSGTPLPKTKSWYDRNVEKINWICSRLGWQQSTVIHKLLVRVGAEYDLNEADRIYQQETGHEKRYMLDLVDYFPELADMATNWIDEMLNWIK